MKENFLFPHKYKRIGWLILIPSAIMGLLELIFEFEPAFLTFELPIFAIDSISGDKLFSNTNKNNFFNEILGICVIISSILVAFSKEKPEDEFISKIRLESLVWAVYFNYSILLLAFIFIYDFDFFWVMVFNMFTVLLFFIVRFNWQIAKLRKSSADAE